MSDLKPPRRPAILLAAGLAASVCLVAGIHVSAALAAGAEAQSSRSVTSSPPTASEAFSFLLGEWEGMGEASAPEGGPRGPFTVRETIKPEAGGQAISLRGIGEAQMQPGAPAVRMHDAFAIIWRDHDGQYRMRSVTMQGHAVEAEVQLTADGFEWGFSAGPVGEFRYRAQVSGDSWHETGYFRAPGSDAWSEFLTMTLIRQASD